MATQRREGAQSIAESGLGAVGRGALSIFTEYAPVDPFSSCPTKMRRRFEKQAKTLNITVEYSRSPWHECWL